jgi:hypothetical protein
LGALLFFSRPLRLNHGKANVLPVFSRVVVKS